jgi:gamma-glutamylcyclotransferase (GGCT)/AIG2-like uncharacterized protein YtfP
MLYFAYGSNMCIRKLHRVAPSARTVGTARLNHYELRFHKASTDGSGKADAFASNNPSAFVLGVLFEIDPKEKAALDASEKGYSPRDVAVVSDTTGKSTSSLTYVANPTSIDAKLSPYSWYLAMVVSGAEEHGLAKAYVTGLRGVGAIEDKDASRDGRNRALLPCEGGGA